MLPKRARRLFKLLALFVGFKVVFILGWIILTQNRHHEKILDNFRLFISLQYVGVKTYPQPTNFEKIDWHDLKFINYEKERKGIGEQGKSHKLTDQEDIELDRQLAEIEGLHVLISDKISVNRSTKDTRPQVCSSIKYLKNLPSTSIIVVIFNEWPSILQRTIHSIYNRTPHKLMKELILVNDCSTKYLEGLEQYVRDNFDDRVKVLNLKERKGLIVARMEGAKVANGEILVFLDAHVEVNTNWLPALLEPVVIRPTTVSTPQVDNIDRNTFEILKLVGVRGLFDDFMWYQYFYLHPRDALNFERPHQIPIMLGAAFAIRRDFFYDLGQYDEGLQIWNGEQIELSLKLHLCGGDLVEVPCSRISHTYRNHQKNHLLNGSDVTARNFKRIAEVWLDDYKEVVYRTDPVKFNVDPGDLRKAKLVKEKLKCKPFQYFLEQIEPEMFTRYFYQQKYPGYFASGRLESELNSKYCLNTLGQEGKPLKLIQCNLSNNSYLAESHFWKLTWHRKLRLWHRDECLQENLVVDFCQFGEKREYQNWKYELDTKQVISLWKDKWCLTATANLTLYLNPCNSTDSAQKWKFDYFNETALRNFDNIFWKNNEVFGLDLT